ncbi:MAG: ATPase [Nanoarchaeota archaeon]|nr:ATPase [Nanoarchaeota archaeon]|tara:strand:- start:32800 stop:35370 length:2571 start_codon:yes stop_codon:yes gene_type:complete
MYYNQKKEEVLKNLNSSIHGLTQKEASERLHKYGLNELKKKENLTVLKLFLKQFLDPLIIILILAAVISFVIQAKIDAIAILAIVLLNSALGFSQEYKAEKSIKLLKKLSSQTVIVLRDSKKIKIDSRKLVPGDIIFLESGDKIPADARLLEVNNLLVDESTLTGESSAVTKVIHTINKTKPQTQDQTNILFSGTLITQGKAKAVVTATNMQTELGKIAHLVQSTESTKTPLQRKLKYFSKVLGIIVLFIAFLVFIVGLLEKFPLYDMFLLSLSLAISAIPEGLPIVITLTLALSIQTMYKKHTLVRKLKSIEALGSVTTICSDKTGTLTKNEMTVTDLFVNNHHIKVTGSGYETTGDFLLNNKKIDSSSFRLLLEIGASCNNAALPNIGDPTELSLLVSAIKANIKPLRKISEVPFDSIEKYMTTTHRIKNQNITYLKGAPEKILDLCDSIKINNIIQRLSPKDKKTILEKNSEMASNALRVLAMAYKQNNKTIFVGLQAMIDPPRREIKKAISLCKKAGIKIYMITGDNVGTAIAIGKQISFNSDKALEGSDLDEISDSELQEVLKTTHIFARVSPQHKSRILKILQKNKEVVAMTGDGVNDAPALKKADIGISMNIKGTDIARDSSDIILLDDNFNSIVQAVRQGRIIYDNIKKFIKYLLSVNFSEIFVVLAALFTKLPIPFLPLQILWMNLVTDSLPALALSKEEGDKKIMDRPPRNHRKSILTGMKNYIIGGGILSFIATLSLFLLEYLNSGNLIKARTIAITTSIMFQMFFVFSCKSNRSLKETSLLNNKYLTGAVILTILLQIIAIYTPLSQVFKFAPLTLNNWITIILVSSIGFIAFETKKLIKKKDS